MPALNKIMSRGFVPPQVHGVLDYPVAAILIPPLAGPRFRLQGGDCDRARVRWRRHRPGGCDGLADRDRQDHPPVLHGYVDTLVTLAMIVLPFAVGFSHHTAALVFYVVVGGALLFATLATRFESPMPSVQPMMAPDAA